MMEAVRGDITRQTVDVIVNAANTSLRGGGGVDGAIHRGAGPDLLAECSTLGRCPTGEVRMTGGYRLAAKHVIHAVGPVWGGGDHGEAELLRSCYRGAIELAVEHGLRSIAFPCISTGVYRYPLEPATRIAVGTVAAAIEGGAPLDLVRFVCFSDADLEVYRAILSEIEG